MRNLFSVLALAVLVGCQESPRPVPVAKAVPVSRTIPAGAATAAPASAQFTAGPAIDLVNPPRQWQLTFGGGPSFILSRGVPGTGRVLPYTVWSVEPSPGIFHRVILLPNNRLNIQTSAGGSDQLPACQLSNVPLGRSTLATGTIFVDLTPIP